MSGGSAIGARYRDELVGRLLSTDGVELSVHDLAPGEGAALLFAHATGLCAGVWRPVAARLAPAFHAYGLDLRGHGGSTLPGGRTEGIWRGFADDVLTTVAGLGLDRPVGVGHSSGGAALLMAEAARPGTFSALWCYEPIIWSEPASARARAARMAAAARRRRAQFRSRTEAYENFAAKPPFSLLDPDALRAYVDGAFCDGPDGTVTLSCTREVEAAVYLGALEDDRFARLADVTCPVVVAVGGRTDAIGPDRGAALVGALPDGRLRVFEALSHFGPLEDPAAVAQAILADLPGPA